MLKPADTSGTSTERKTAISSRIESPTTAATKIGSRSAILAARSSNTAVAPPTWAAAPVPRSASGSVLSRSRSTSSDVRESCGDVLGITLITAASRPGLSTAGATEATPAVSRAAFSTRASRARSSPPCGSSTASWSGPLKPGPKPSASRS